jgi:hypothetical protein
MERKRSRTKSNPVAHICPNCEHESEVKDGFCGSCETTRQAIIGLLLKRAKMIRYAPLYFMDGIVLYRIWQRASRRERVINKGHIIDKWFGQNRQAIYMDNTKRQKKFFKLHDMFTDFVTRPILLSQAEEKLEAMFKILERR